jgi:YD repeat-containing protein
MTTVKDSPRRARRSAKSRKTLKPFWERGYNGHAYWLGRAKLGKVTRHTDQGAKHKYTWEAAGKAGTADQLDQARRAVELAVALSDKQLDLFS